MNTCIRFVAFYVIAPLSICVGSLSVLGQGCPCTCTANPEASGSYALSATTTGETVSWDAQPEAHSNALAYTNDWDTWMGFARGWAYSDEGYESASANASVDGAFKEKVYQWTGAPSEAPGALYTLKFSGNGSINVDTYINRGVWGSGSTSAGGDSTSAGSAPGQVCSGSTNLNSISGGVEGVSGGGVPESWDVSAGAEIGTSPSVSFSTSNESLDNTDPSYTATITRTWQLEAQGEHCSGAGTTEIHVRATKQLSLIASCTAYAYAGGGFSTTASADVDGTSSLVGEAYNIRRCDL